MIDLRSDTVTRPSAAMKEAMMNAPLGDDVFAEDTTVIRLEKMAAEMFGMEAALFCPSGTMTNQIAVKAHTQPLDELIIHKLSHIYYYEVGGIAFNSGVSVKLCDGPKGFLRPEDVTNNILPDHDWFPNTSLVCLENTTNKGGGACYELDNLQAIAKTCQEAGLKLHLDGARLFNAMVEKKYTGLQIGELFDSISICLSKGLGAPVGSLLLADGKLIKKARKIRKVLGGGMRQAGIIAAAGIYALEHNIARLVDDHKRAKVLGQCLEQQPYIAGIRPVETNLVIFETIDSVDASELTSALREREIAIVNMDSSLVRFATHLDFDDEMLDKVCTVLDSLHFAG